MKRNSEPIFKTYYPQKFYLKDIYKIIETFKEIDEVFSVPEKDRKQVYVVINGYTLDSIEEIKNFEEIKVDKLTIAKSSGVCRFSLEVTENGARLYISEDSIICLGILKQIDCELSKLKRRIEWPTIIGFISSVILGASIGLLPQISRPSPFFTWAIIIGIIALLLLILEYVIRFKQKTLIVLSNSTINFWQRNQDQIINGIIGAVIGSIITIITTLLLFKIGISK